MSRIMLFCVVFAGLVAAGETYEVVLKSGKVIQGMLVKEDDSGFLIRNNSGLEFTVSKKTVDLEKTAAANKPDAPKSAKRARVYTKDDIEQMREKHNLGTFDGAVEVPLLEFKAHEKIKMDEGFNAEVLESNVPVLVDFFATWCAPCRKVSPIVDAVGEEFSGSAKIYKVDIDKNRELSRIYQIASIPTLVFFKDGEEVGRMVGLASRSAISTQMKKLVE